MSKPLTSHAPVSPSSVTLPHHLNHSRTPREKIFLGIDGGGTKTHAVITTAAYEVIGEGLSGASNPLRIGLAEAIANIDQAVTEACAQAGINRHDITSACAAIAGI